MKKNKTTLFFFYVSLLIVFNIHPAFGWDDNTHLAAAKAADYYRWYAVVGPDITKVKAGKIEMYNHFFDNDRNVEVTPKMVFEQVERYNNPEDMEGHLYGAILASLREYNKHQKDAEYHIDFCVHYITDLSAPLHNVIYDDFNKTRHAENDGVIGGEVLDNINRLKRLMYQVDLRHDHFEDDLAKEIAVIANKARHLGHKLKKENRAMTKEEAYNQLAQSASLINTALKHLGTNPRLK
ncbi:MAG: hypothetical protein HZB61_04390 [Nitrospirae bacterium]|nr:hypothetical protein [Nitrospirota bacterium]